MRNYQYKWGVYRAWCRRNNRSISSPSVQKIADFLLHLHRDLNLSVSAIRGYKSVLTLVYKRKLPDISVNSVLRDLLRSFVLARPRRGPSFPSWDVNQVLSSLSKPPYEPMAEASFLDLTKKTLFLVSLATVKRVGELKAVSSKVSKQGTSLVLSYVPSFVAKTENQLNPLPRHFIVKSLCDFSGPDLPDRVLCPVRALKYYLNAISKFKPRPANLFVSPKYVNRSISSNAISFFLRQVIRDGDVSSSRDQKSCRAHSIRGAGASLAFRRNWSCSDVLSAATWKSNTVFTSFYLNDLAFELEDVKSLGPFVAAGQTFNS